MNPLAALLAGPPGSGAAGSPTAGQAQSPQTGLFAALLGADGELQLNAQTTIDPSGQSGLAGLLAAQQSASGDALALGIGPDGDGSEAAALTTGLTTLEGLDALAPTLGPLTERTETGDAGTAGDPSLALVDTAATPEQTTVTNQQDGDGPVPGAATPQTTSADATQTQTASVSPQKQTAAPPPQTQTANAAPTPTTTATPATPAGPAPQPAQTAPAADSGDGASAAGVGETRRPELAQARTPLPENSARGRANLARTVETLTVAASPAGGQSLVQVVERDTGGGKSAIALDPAVSSLQMRAGPATPTPGGPQAPQIPLNNLAVHIAQQAQNGNRRFDIRLDPPELGRLEIRLDVSRDGQVTTHMVVERSETLDLLQRDSRALERALQNAGLDTSEGGLKFSLKGQGQGQAQDTGPDGKPKGDGSASNADPEGDAGTDDADMIGAGRHYVARDGLDIRI